MEIKTSEQLKVLVNRVGDESLLEQTIYQSLSQSFREKLRELPPPPAGFYYRPAFKHAEFKDGEYTITSDIFLEPIISEEALRDGAVIEGTNGEARDDAPEMKTYYDR